jgi:glutamyl-Q tRNA(Asp) synthetase
MTQYRGRFAPSPTGPLHFGSLLAAMASYADALAHGGTWLVRMEDLDPPREVPGAAGDILDTLRNYGFAWEDEVWFQSTRSACYEAALARLDASGLLYACCCTRRDLVLAPLGAGGERVYPGTCREAMLPFAPHYAWRVRVPDTLIRFRDLLRGEQTQQLAHEAGDFIVRRADGLVAYQLAVVVDDALQGITHVVRGSDLLSSTARQIWLQQVLQLPAVEYLHIPVAINAAGEKLSKQTRAQPLPRSGVATVLRDAWRFLDQPAPPPAVDTPAAFWDWARGGWARRRLPPVAMLPATGLPARA